MKALSLFSGIGGPELALGALGVETIAHSEIEPYASAVFAKRFPESVNLGDVRGITGELSQYDVIVGGFPCQDISNAGARAGIEGARSGLWGEFARIIGEVQPKLVLIENVSALLNRGLLRVLTDLDNMAYEVEWDCIPAAAVGAPHLRDRIWIVATRQPTESYVFSGQRQQAVGSLRFPPSKLPRSGSMDNGTLYSYDPIAPRKTRREDGRSYWNGVNLGSVRAEGSALWPTPTTQDGANNGGPAQFRRNSLPLNAAVLWPTPKSSASHYGRPRPNDWGDLQASVITEQSLWPTAVASWNENRGTRRGPTSPQASHARCSTPTGSSG